MKAIFVYNDYKSYAWIATLKRKVLFLLMSKVFVSTMPKMVRDFGQRQNWPIAFEQFDQLMRLLHSLSVPDLRTISGIS